MRRCEQMVENDGLTFDHRSPRATDAPAPIARGRAGGCAQCGEHRPVMVQMSYEGKLWDLCSRCWIEGRQPFKVGLIHKALAKSQSSESKRKAKGRT
jgi:hypothetical protein